MTKDKECDLIEKIRELNSMTSVFRAFDRVARSNNRVINIPTFIDAKNLKPYINQEVKGLITPIEYRDGKSKLTGYNALSSARWLAMYIDPKTLSDAIALHKEAEQ